MLTFHGLPGSVPAGVELRPTVAQPPASAAGATTSRARMGRASSERRTGASPFLEHPLYTGALRGSAVQIVQPRGLASLGSRSAERWSRSSSRCRGWCGRCCARSGVELSFPLVALIAFTPYVALTSPVPVVAALALRRWAVAGVAAVAAVALGLAMVPRAVAGPQPEADGPRLVVMTLEPVARAGRTRARCCGSRASTTSTC